MASGSRAECSRDYFRYGYIADPLTIYRHVRKVPPAHVLAFRSDGACDLSRYWTPFAQAENRLHMPEEEIVEELEILLRDAFTHRLVSDVPVGVFLSGGIDSSLVTALLRDAGAEVQTYTIGFDSTAFDESAHAAAVADHLPDRSSSEDPPSGRREGRAPAVGRSLRRAVRRRMGIPTLLVSEFASERVTVALLG